MTTISDNPAKAFLQLITESADFAGDGRLLRVMADLAEAISHLPRSMGQPSSELSFADPIFASFPEESEYDGPTHGGGHGGGNSAGTQGVELALDLFKGFSGDVDI